MKNRTIILGLGALVAIGIIMSRKDKLLDEANEDFREGYVAGFFTPGPFTILAVTGAIAYNS